MIELTSLLVLALALAGPLAVAHIGRSRGEDAENLATNLLCQLLLAVLAMVSLWLMLDPLQFSLGALGFGAPDLSTILWGAGMAAFFVFALGPILLRLPHWLGLEGFEGTLSALARLPLWYLVLAVVVGGIVEEVLYRGVALAILMSFGFEPLLAAALVVAVFGLAHIPMWGVGPALTTVISGAFLTVFFLWHGDLLANIIAHIATDLVGITLGPFLSWVRGPR
ncbi:CPBP family glutamic-type intramembrane protease [uncultured Roseobacter sp.]|uniref:CPBP family glutamic-type intramembrane protease n=1 Tax=uncultured Roseobacter sp. TaxID=114847 RepID=UPI002612CCA5|nr:CPBP family glutamic-type intramembrane protease [uncultured Roseobacter sp.]